MGDNIMNHIAEYYRTRHALVLKLVDTLDDEQVMWRPNKTTPAIGFHVWHLARWADYLQEMLTEGGVQIWEQESLATRWGFDSANLGFAETGLEMADDASATLPLPKKAALLDYARRVFAQADQVVSNISDEQYHRKIQDRRGGTGEEVVLGDTVLNLTVHASRHLGMIEAIVGVQGRRGTATR